MAHSASDCYPPWNFSWVAENELAVMGCPQKTEHVNYILKVGIRHLVTLSPETLPALKSTPEVEWTQIPINEFTGPTVKQIIKFIDVCKMCQSKKQAVGVHCRMGIGRSGVMAACYLVHFQQTAPQRAIINLRLQRPGSIETAEQERSVIRYHDFLLSASTSDIEDDI